MTKSSSWYDELNTASKPDLTGTRLPFFPGTSGTLGDVIFMVDYIISTQVRGKPVQADVEPQSIWTARTLSGNAVSEESNTKCRIFEVG